MKKVRSTIIFVCYTMVISTAEIGCFIFYQILPQRLKKDFPTWLLKRIIQDIDPGVAI